MAASWYHGSAVFRVGQYPVPVGQYPVPVGQYPVPVGQYPVPGEFRRLKVSCEPQSIRYYNIRK